jgi:hypothetical protein
MIKVKNKEAYAHLFEEYTHNIPVIYSSLEGQYNGELFVDEVNNPQVAILFTPFDFHFVAGNAEISDVINLVDDTVFNQYLLKTDQKEAILFAPNQKWNKILDEVFKRHNGIKDNRMVFCLNKDKYQKQNKLREISSDSVNRLLLEKEQSSQREYPVGRVYLEEKCVSFCSGFMLGKGHAEINIGTVEAFRGKGYAKDAAFTLINHLLKDDIEPDWCTWPYRVESQKLACSLGFELSEEVPVFIWVEDECGKIQ